MATDLPALTAALTAGRDLAPDEAAAAALSMADAQVADAVKEAFLLALARKGETAAEVTGFAKTYRSLARRTDFGGSLPQGDEKFHLYCGRQHCR